jgi:hypothetical protein
MCLFAGQAVLYGSVSAFLQYAEPGIGLARAVRTAIFRCGDRHKTPPMVVLLENHAPSFLGQSAEDVEGLAAMSRKRAQIYLGAMFAGGPRGLSQKDIERIAARCGLFS